MTKNIVNVVWKSNKTRRNYLVGEIRKNTKYEFRYLPELKQAQEAGFELFFPFPESNATYYNNELFPVFATRLPDKKRPDIDTILKKYNLKEYNDFELLKHGAELPTDDLKFVCKADSIEDLCVEGFYIAGARHYLGCDGRNCENSELKTLTGKNPVISQEKTNENDPNAIKIEYNDKVIGYVPRYYTQIINKSLEDGMGIDCIVSELNNKKPCDKCVKIRLQIK